MRLDNRNKRLMVVACAFAAGLAVGLPFRALDAQVDNTADELAQVREALTRTPSDSLMFLIVKPESDDATRVWFSFQGKASNPEQSPWLNVVMKNESRMLIGIDKDHRPAFATPIPSEISAENLQSLLDEWRTN